MRRRASVLLLSLALTWSTMTTTSAALLPPLQTVLDLIDTTTCTLPLLSSSPKLDAAVQRWARLGGRGTVRIIVSAQGGLLGTVKTIVSALGVPLLSELTGINAVVVEVNSSGLSTLACSTAVASISIDAVVSGTSEPGVEYSVRSTLGVPAPTPAGAGVGVAVIDSGIAPSADFGDRIVGFFDFTNGAKATAPSDAYGHGTHVAGLIAGSASLGGGVDYRGVGPQALLIGMKVLDANGSGRTSDVIRAVDYATSHRASLNIQVINLSLGHPVFEPAAKDPLVRAVEAASRAGIVVVAAAGNLGYDEDLGQSGYGGITSPGNAPSAITVGAITTKDTTTRADDEVAPYSSRGPAWYDGFVKPDIVAPGHGLVSTATSTSTLYTKYPLLRVGTNYLRLSGTSMAAAVTSGTVALLLEANRAAHPNAPRLTPNAVKAILQFSSLPVRDRYGVPYDDLTEGAGALNAVGAIDIARAIDTSVPVGSYWWTTNVAHSSVIGGATYVWDEHIVWGTNYIGKSTDGEHIVWGTATDPATTVWGNLADATDPPQ